MSLFHVLFVDNDVYSLRAHTNLIGAYGKIKKMDNGESMAKA